MTATLNGIDLGTVTAEDPIETSYCKIFPMSGKSSEHSAIYEPGGAALMFVIRGWKDFDTRAALATWAKALLALNTGNQTDTVVYHSESLNADYDVKIIKIQTPWRRKKELNINYIIKLYRGSA